MKYILLTLVTAACSCNTRCPPSTCPPIIVHDTILVYEHLHGSTGMHETATITQYGAGMNIITPPHDEITDTDQMPIYFRFGVSGGAYGIFIETPTHEHWKRKTIN